MDSEIRKELFKAEDAIIVELTRNPLIHKAYKIGLDNGLSLEQIGLLCVPHLLEQIKVLENLIKLQPVTKLISCKESLPPYFKAQR